MTDDERFETLRRINERIEKARAEMYAEPTWGDIIGGVMAQATKLFVIMAALRWVLQDVFQ